MMKELKKLIISAKNRDHSAMMEIIKMFEPLVDSYVIRSNFSEDIRSELILTIIEAVNSIDLSNMRSTNEFTLIKYFYSSIRYKYIRFSKMANYIRNFENGYEDLEDNVLDKFEAKHSECDHENDVIAIKDLMKNILPPTEYMCIDMIILNDCKSKDIAQLMGVSKQAISNSKKRALKKLRKYFE